MKQLQSDKTIENSRRLYVRMIRICLLTFFTASPAFAAEWKGFRPSPWFNERVREQWIDTGVRVVMNAPDKFDDSKPTHLIVFATPNGNTIEQTLGCKAVEGADFHFDIQHIAAQTRKLREITKDENIVLAVLESEGLSWPAWNKKHADGPARIRKIVETLRGWIPAKDVSVTLSCHSGGGSFVFGYVNGGDAIPDFIRRIVYLDANYSYSDELKHGDKLLTWLKGNKVRRLVVIAYDDRNITLNGKPVVGPTGGTFRATERMKARFDQDEKATEFKAGDFVHRFYRDGQIAMHVHFNPQNKILHTALVGEMNGHLRAQTEWSEKPSWGTFGGPRAYSAFVQPAPVIPPRPKDAKGGAEFMKSLDSSTRQPREDAIAKEILSGNIPDFLRKFQKVTVKDGTHTSAIEVMPDYLAIGSDADFVRVPMTPMTAEKIADAFGCALPTRKMVDEIHQAATIKLDPIPMTKDREASATFLQHHSLIEKQRSGKTLGDLVSGMKKDVVLSNRIAEKENRVAIYGWHRADGKPIQPLTIVHVNWYVDYSHGVRLIKRTATTDGKSQDLRITLYSEPFHKLWSDEGPILYPGY